MSTKIYNGIKFKSNKLSEVIRQLHSIKKESIQFCGERLSDVNDRNFRILCYLVREFEKEHEKPIEYTFQIERIIKENLKKDYKDYHDLHLCFNVTIFEHNNELYGIFFDDTNVNFKLLFEKNIAEDFHYQNQSDKPENISLNDWEDREEIWETIFNEISPCWVPSEAGVTYDIVSSDTFTGFDLHFINEELIEKIKKFNIDFENAKKEGK